MNAAAEDDGIATLCVEDAVDQGTVGLQVSSLEEINIVARAARENIGTSSTAQQVIAGATLQRVVAVVAVQLVLAFAATERVDAQPTVEDVITGVTGEIVITLATVEIIIPHIGGGYAIHITKQVIVAAAAGNSIVTARADQRVAAIAAVDDIVAM